ncbi:hypothetical protein B0J18DRAFT_368540 [Chaetomium sp. MPI-SDFR-AT-0129]|nr:hypothetical protein B0J18DRAFT_368540 [Chaetomium sp. MPI-SDFR-AT-0129]
MEELPPLLRLPQHLRRCIYDFVGLASLGSDGLHLSRTIPNKFDLHGRPVDPPASPPSTFHGLLLSCRTIYAEAAAVIYSGNLFVLRYNPADPEPLRPLHALTPTALASLTSLSIILNQASCHQHCGHADYGFCCVDGRDDDGWSGLVRCKLGHGNTHQLPLLAHSLLGCQDADVFAAAQNLLTKWRLAAACLSHIPAGRLELALVCDIDPHHERAREVASLIIEPLLIIPQLRDCRIRLCKIPDAALQQIAQDGVLQARRIAPPPYYSPKPSTRTQASLVGLPRELRLRILEYTDLIAPGREVTWSRQDQAYFTAARGDDLDGDDVRVFYHCWTSSRPSPSYLGCFCRRRHAAFSLACKCWAPPSPLFLVCRILCEDAQFTFFSRNRFIIHDYKTSKIWALPFFPEYENYPGTRFAASQFLRDVIPTHCLAYLRFLELVFPPYLAQTWPRGDDHPVLQDWQATIDWLLDKVNAPALTLRLAGAEGHYGSPYQYHNRISKSDAIDIATAHMDLTPPLKALGDIGLARFFAYFPCPWELVLARHQRYHMRPRMEAKQRQFKASFERMVLGDRYETQYANGREEPEPSFWAEAHHRL